MLERWIHPADIVREEIANAFEHFWIYGKNSHQADNANTYARDTRRHPTTRWLEIEMCRRSFKHAQWWTLLPKLPRASYVVHGQRRQLPVTLWGIPASRWHRHRRVWSWALHIIQINHFIRRALLQKKPDARYHWDANFGVIFRKAPQVEEFALNNALTVRGKYVFVSKAGFGRMKAFCSM